MVAVMSGKSAPATECSPLTIIKQMEMIFLKLGFSQVVSDMLVYDQEIYSPLILASLSNEEIIMIYDVIRRPGGLVGHKTLDRGNQISVLAMKSMKLTAFMLMTLECCARAYDIKYVNSTFVLTYQHQWELEQKKLDDLKVPKVDKNNGQKLWAKTMGKNYGEQCVAPQACKRS